MLVEESIAMASLVIAWLVISSSCYGGHRPVMLFCPNCANLLVISAQTGYNKWACNTCAYEFPIAKQVVVENFYLRDCSFIPDRSDDIPNKNDPQTSG